jgi:hypothetical protein
MFKYLAILLSLSTLSQPVYSMFLEDDGIDSCITPGAMKRVRNFTLHVAQEDLKSLVHSPSHSLNFQFPVTINKQDMVLELKVWGQGCVLAPIYTFDFAFPTFYKPAFKFHEVVSERGFDNTYEGRTYGVYNPDKDVPSRFIVDFVGGFSCTPAYETEELIKKQQHLITKEKTEHLFLPVTLIDRNNSETVFSPSALVTSGRKIIKLPDLIGLKIVQRDTQK